MEFTFEQLPKAVADLAVKLESIEQILLAGIPANQILEQDPLFTIQEAGEFLKLSVPTIYGLVSRSEIPVSKKGKRLYFSKQELTDWIKSGRKKTTAEIEAEAENFVTRRK